MQESMPEEVGFKFYIQFIISCKICGVCAIVGVFKKFAIINPEIISSACANFLITSNSAGEVCSRYFLSEP